VDAPEPGPRIATPSPSREVWAGQSSLGMRILETV
jgi:hypothetical protein